jgi:hypothetical protein
MNNTLTTAGRCPRFWYGAAERQVAKKSRYQLCLIDLKYGLFAWLNFPIELRQAMEILTGVVGGEAYGHRIFELPFKNFSSEVGAEDFEDLLGEQDALAERDSEESALSLCSSLMTRSDHLRKFDVVETNHLFLEHLAAEALLAEQLKDNEGKPDSDSTSRASHQLVCEMRAAGEIESEDDVYGPFFFEDMFTKNLSLVPEWIKIQAMCKLIDLDTLSAQAKGLEELVRATEEETRLAFHPELERETRESRGHTGMINTGSPDTDIMLERIRPNR